jgi:hypothetical protein
MHFGPMRHALTGWLAEAQSWIAANAAEAKAGANRACARRNRPLLWL